MNLLLDRPPGTRARSGHGADHLGYLLHDFADLVLADNQGWGQRQGVAGNAQHQVVVEEGAVEPVEAALAYLVWTRGKVDPGSQSDGADVDHVRLVSQRHHRVGEFGFERS